MPIIEINNLYHTYLPGTPYQREALRDISLSVQAGETLGIYGANGSGKTTLVQHLNGLLQPTRGKVVVCGVDTADRSGRRHLWKKVGLVFQHPEQQIFQTSVFDEIAYGPRNLGVSAEEVRQRVNQALLEVGLLPQQVAPLAPHNLSGGMKRRVGIAGLLALEPEILVMDEPMAGLDATGRQLIKDIIATRLQAGLTSVIISHHLEDILSTATTVAVLEQGSLVYMGTVQEFSADNKMLSRYRKELPDTLRLRLALAEHGLEADGCTRTSAPALEVLCQWLREADI